MIPIGGIILMLSVNPIPDGFVDGLTYNDISKNYCRSVYFKMLGIGEIYQNGIKCLVRIK